MTELQDTKQEKVRNLNEPISMAHYLISKFGVLMTTEQLAAVLNRSYISLYSFLQRSDSDEAKQLNAAKKRVGRNIYFKSLKIAKFLEE